MKYTITLLVLCLAVLSCNEEPGKLSSTDAVNWEKRKLAEPVSDSLEIGHTFLSIYSSIYMRNDQEQSDLTATVSLHNPNRNEDIFIDRAVYYNTQGEPIRTYFDHTIFIRPLETVQIVIDGTDKEGGTGANFIFDWKKKPASNEPLFEAVMINTFSSQGLSFLTEGKRIK
ncbi:DUF3124 domain-containing protein [Pricia sp. S334]|uniref:DUF3124 domain-containing protein n=1 Tax=Pricia mediterranea TaxID=3076079 RepID=A0ABU3L2U8_9FLAO|nr:DUF3124 domain-containing protein [Pricia sp. S334]MDT7827514.1 DUF3124 domain-containing protein [Pricia sp. S334]